MVSTVCVCVCVCMCMRVGLMHCVCVCVSQGVQWLVEQVWLFCQLLLIQRVSLSIAIHSLTHTLSLSHRLAYLFTYPLLSFNILEMVQVPADACSLY